MARKAKNRLKIVHPDCAGIDIGKSRHYVAVDPAVCDDPVRSFDAFTEDLEALAAWLRQCGVTVVAMESTGVYWIPLYEILDRAGFEVHLVNPRAVKQVSGRKRDVLDCQWIWQLMSYGLLKGAFRPADNICELRAYVRSRDQLTKDAGRCVQHMQKALTQMNLHLDSVLSDIMGKTGQLILRAIVAGERDGIKLAQFRDRRVKADAATIAKSLQGNWRAEHLFSLTQALERYDFLQTQIRNCEARIQDTLGSLTQNETSPEPLARPGRSVKERNLQFALRELKGVDVTAVPTIGIETALTLAAEVGPDLSRFPNSEHFCSWLNLAPGTRISGGRKLPGRIATRINRTGQLLRMAAMNARSSNSFIGAAHRGRLARMDSGRAVKATAHQLDRIIYVTITKGNDYVETSIEQFELERRERQLRNLKRRAQQMGMMLIEDANAA